jgi:hypothetical protein
MPQVANLVIYGVYARLIDDIKHYDTVQATYRTMTSSLLLASFAAIGFLYSLKPHTLPMNLAFWIICIGIISLAATTTMAVLDLIYQERLMIANVIEALKLESQYHWLPKIHHQLLTLKTHPASPNRKSLFYIGCGASLILIMGHSIGSAMHYSTVAVIFISILTLLAIIIYSVWLYKASKNFEDLIDGHFDYKQIKQMDLNDG